MRFFHSNMGFYSYVKEMEFRIGLLVLIVNSRFYLQI